MRISILAGLSISALAFVGCSTGPSLDASLDDAGLDTGSTSLDTGTRDAGSLDGAIEAGSSDAGSSDAAPDHDAFAIADASVDARASSETSCTDGLDEDGDGLKDCDDVDCVRDDACAYSCGAFTTAPVGWTLAEGLRAVVVADATDGLEEPVGLTFAGGDLGGLLYVSDQAAAAVFAIDVDSGDTAVFAATSAFPAAPALLTAIVWDADRVNDGNLYVTDSVSNADQDAVIYRLDPSGTVSVFVRAPGPGLDSIYAMAFAPPGFTPAGLYVAGDTDGAARIDWGVFDRDGMGTAFSEVAGIEGIAFDRTGRYGTGPIAARPSGGGYSGDGSITPIGSDGVALTPIATGLGGVHASVVAPAGLFGGDLIAASWSTNSIFRVSPTGEITTVVAGVSLSNYDANVLAVSPDGRVLLVADRNASRIVCVEEL
ncbi:MAG: hypothetical protein J0L92_34045 [Deltaproteobacteria bacterium]|nr:hypothetical protein [Deltaproteobacteria bacterium]